MLQEKEEQLLKKRMIELAGLCYQRDIQTSTGFLWEDKLLFDTVYSCRR